MILFCFVAKKMIFKLKKTFFSQVLKILPKGSFWPIRDLNLVALIEYHEMIEYYVKINVAQRQKF